MAEAMASDNTPIIIDLVYLKGNTYPDNVHILDVWK